MKNIKAILGSTLCTLVVMSASAQSPNVDVVKLGSTISNANVRNEVRIPMVDGLIPIKCDLHTHTIFSDGYIMPSVRVDEAWQDGLDAVAITDHIEYRPFKEQVLGDHNEANKQAIAHAKNLGIIVIPGTEITRNKPLGHLNALFVEDANKIAVKDELESIDNAVEQGAFILWNHPGWPDDKSTLYPVHEELIKAKKIHGIEVFNYMEYYPITFDWCNDFDLAYVGNSDIHETIEYAYGNVIRPMTVVYGKALDANAIKEGLFARRTFAYFAGQLAGDSELLKKVVKASLKTRTFEDSMVEVYNDSDISYTLTNGEGRTIILPAEKTVRFKTQEGEFTVTNCHTGALKNLTVELSDIL